MNPHSLTSSGIIPDVSPAPAFARASFLASPRRRFSAWFSVAAALAFAALPTTRANVPGGGTAGAAVTLTDGGTTATLDNGIVKAVVKKSSAQIGSLIYNGKEMIDPKGLYWSMDGGASYQNPANCIYTVVVNTPSMVDVSCKHVYASGDAHAVDIEIHYVLRQGNTGLYVYALLNHPASYPAFVDGEWRMVWSVSADPSNTDHFLLEKVYADSLRHWKAPTLFDLKNGTTMGIKEIQLLNTGERAGQYECKYEYALEYYKVGTYGWASDVYKMGEWIVLGNYEYFNDGPPKQDLGPAPNGGGLLLHFGRNHFNGSGLNIPTGQAWSKLYGPFFLYFNTNPAGGDACWADAQAQVTAERSAWPYTWLNHPLYPQNAARGKVTGRLVINDPLKPAQTGAGAWVGVTDAPAGTNWQMWGQGYQYWVRADANGNFTIPAVRPGQLTLSAYVSGEVGEFTQTNVNVTANGTTALGNVVWNVVHPGLSIAWEIGTPDRRSEEFAEGSTNYYVPYEYQTLYQKFPNPLTYTIGTSNPATDFPYVQSALWQPSGTPVAWPWHINFTLPNVPATGNATLTLAFAGAHAGPQVNVYVNDESTVFANVIPSVVGGNGLLREVNHGKYCVEYVTIPVSRLRSGANTITLVQSSIASDSSHVMYDYLNLELPTPPAFQPVVYQFENGTTSAGGVVETINAGWTGSGYINTANAIGAFAEMIVNVPAAGTYNLTLRFANGTTIDRPADLSINGVSVQTGVSFPATGAWTTWTDLTVSKNLNAGNNTIRLTATTANGCANLDKLTISQ